MNGFIKLYTVLASFEATIAERRDNKGATAVEYALVIGLASLVIVGALAAFGPKLTTFINGLSFS